ncbi:MAG: apaH [Herminiimonas sp.]|nr:apaH [Herminiimonas sp.]
MATYAVGDVQGCHAPLVKLLRKIDQKDSAAEFVFVGDLVNRGPQSLATLRHVAALGTRATVLLGNHDLHLLAAAHDTRGLRAGDSLQDILNAPDCGPLLDWLRCQPLAVLRNQHLFVHAGVLPQWSALETVALAEEVNAALGGPRWKEFLSSMYGNEPAKWDERLIGADRLRCIVNALTRIRYCRPDGTMVFDNDGNEPSKYPDVVPWFDVPGRETRSVTTVFGHWSKMGLVLRADLIGLDTGCVWGGKLTAVNLQDRTVIQVACPRYQSPRHPKDAV